MLTEGFDGVLHFAALALVGESVAHPERYYRTNVGGTLNLLEAMRVAEVRRLVFSSTCAVYGQPDEVPISETAPPRPANAYGASKLAVDHMIGDFCIAHGLGAVSLRYFNVAGASGGVRRGPRPRDPPDPEHPARSRSGVNPHVEIFGTDYPTPDGTAIRDYIHIEDLAAAHLLALEGTRGGEHRIFNLGNGNGFSVREVIAAAQRGHRRRDRDASRRRAARATRRCSWRRAQRIRAELGWEARKPELAEMVADAWAFAQAHPRGYSS